MGLFKLLYTITFKSNGKVGQDKYPVHSSTGTSDTLGAAKAYKSLKENKDKTVIKVSYPEVTRLS